MTPMCTGHDHSLPEIVGLEERIAELQARVDLFQAAVEAESAVREMVLEGNTNIPAIVKALRCRADVLMESHVDRDARLGADLEHPADTDRRLWLATEMKALAAQIEKETGIT